MAIGLIKNSGGVPVISLKFTYNGTTVNSELKKGESITTRTQTISHSRAFTHTYTYTTTEECGNRGVHSWYGYTLDDGTVVYQYSCDNGHIIGSKGSGGSVRTPWDEYTSPCTHDVTTTHTTTVTDCASNTSHGTMAYKLTSIDNAIQISLVPSLSQTSISSCIWTYKTTSGSASTIGTSSSVMYKGLGTYSCTITFYDSNSGSSTSHNYTQTFSLVISEYKKKRK